MHVGYDCLQGGKRACGFRCNLVAQVPHNVTVEHRAQRSTWLLHQANARPVSHLAPLAHLLTDHRAAFKSIDAALLAQLSEENVQRLHTHAGMAAVLHAAAVAVAVVVALERAAVWWGDGSSAGARSLCTRPLFAVGQG